MGCLKTHVVLPVKNGGRERFRCAKSWVLKRGVLFSQQLGRNLEPGVLQTRYGNISNEISRFQSFGKLDYLTNTWQVPALQFRK